MVEKTTGSTVPRRQLGRYLRDLRGRAGITVRAAARQLEWSEPKIWRIETGQTSMRSLDVQAMCMIYGAPADLTEVLMALAKETKSRGWWHSYGDGIPEWFNLYVGLEEAAVSMSAYQSELVPGLLQTDDYAREIIRIHEPDLSDGDLEDRLDLRMVRQNRISRDTNPLQLRVVVAESVLRRPIGGVGVMSRQLAHLVYVSELANVTLRVAPFETGAHYGVVSGPFLVLRFPKTADGGDSEPPTVYSEGLTGGLYLDKPAEVEQFETAYRGIWEAALDEQGSRRLLAEVAGSYVQG
ncbi:helix-turn-helix domain-containing protein [Streptomyces profundus]|uniref:helix-turn-helix domain-containing protein n=1 Tax=Streptomyces profundus TaxID=2867410 RepID=UPI001D167E26|nr:helix-turn-helix transcriptional regulator [Streptomyces sp. MA3_2.13]UED84086.1 helix-turn-helix domain-containing protein [Streptomyces sp. MA3_2.13]